MKSAKGIGSWGVLCIALAAGGVAFWLSHNYLNSQEASLRERLLGSSGESRDVVVALAPVLPGDEVGPHNMAIAQVPAKHLSAEAIPPDRFHLYDGQIVRHPMSPGEPLLTHFLAGDAISRFSELLETGERAVTVEVSEVTSNAGMLTSGDYVDLFLLTGDSSITNEPKDEKALVLLRERVRVLSVGRAPLRSKEQDFDVVDPAVEQRYATVTVGVPRDDAARITLANKLGDFVFMLRGPDDKRIHGDEILSQQMLRQALSDSAGVEFYVRGANKNGFLTPTYISTQSLQARSERGLQKSVALNRTPAEVEPGN